MYSLRDINIVPKIITNIESRSKCNPFVTNIEGTKDGFLPIITAPMSCVLSDLNYKEYHDQGISTIIPRTVDSKKRVDLMTSVFCAFSMSEAKDILNFPIPENNEFYYILLDMANGHMKEQIDLGKQLKNKFGEKIKLMGGNIANPETYKLYEWAGFDYLRIGIGGGNSCLSSTQTGIHYGMASLISDTCDLRGKDYKCKIIADGGIGGFSDVIKCLALGADYVMCGRIFTKAAKSGEEIGDLVNYYGMSTKKAQLEMGKSCLKTSEGREVILKKEYTLPGWVENMRDYLRSTMSYCDSIDLREFKEKAECRLVSQSTSSMVNDK